MTQSDTHIRQRFPNIGKLSAAILENLVEKVIGGSAIEEVKKPYAQKEVANSLGEALAKVEADFIAQYTDLDAREALLQLPIHDLPSAQTAIWSFYQRPNDSQFADLLIAQLKLIKRLSAPQIDHAVTSYMKLLRREFVNVDAELRDKLRTLALLDIADTVKELLEAIIRERRLTPDDADALKSYLAEVRPKWDGMLLPLIRRKKTGGDILNAKLKQVFVPLKLRDVRAEEESQRRMERMVRPDKMREDEEKIRAVEIGELLDRYPRFILIGPPGCGKTTLLNRVALAFAEGRAAEDLGWKGANLFPIFVRLRNFGAFLKSNRSNYPEPCSGALIAYLENQFDEGERLNLTADFFDRRLAEGNCIVLLDGLDEVSELRSEVAHYIDAFVARYGAKGNRIGLASRPRGYESVELPLRRIGLAVSEVNPLETKGINQLIGNLLNIIEPEAGLRAHDLGELTRAISASDELTRIAGTPLFCSALVQVYKYNNAKLPHRRVDIFDEIVDLLLGNWHAQQRNLSEAEQLAIDDGTGRPYREVRDAVTAKLRRLCYLADAMQQKFRKAEISKQEAEGILIDYLKSRERVSNDETAQTWAENFLINSHERSGLLVEHEPEIYSFLHKGFMEYLAATALVNQSKTLVETLLSNINDQWWEQVILLAGAHPRLAEDVRVELVNSLLDKAGSLADGSEERMKHIIVAGELARDMAEYLPGPEQERVETSLYTTATDAEHEPVFRASAADALDELGYLPTDLYDFVTIPYAEDHSSFILHAERSSFCISKYPITNAQYERFLQRENFENKDLWRGFPMFDENSQEMKGSWDKQVLKWLNEEAEKEDGIVYPRYWRDPRFGISRRNAPLVGITWYEANAYCKWLSQHWHEQPEADSLPPSAFVFRLPTETEWQLAAGGVEPESRFAWGTLKDKRSTIAPMLSGGPVDENEITRYANTSESGINRTTPVWMYPQGASDPHKIMDMSGNVWEWQANYSGKDHDYLRLRGGSWGASRGGARVSVRGYDLPDYGDYGIGFRVVALPSG